MLINKTYISQVNRNVIRLLQDILFNKTSGLRFCVFFHFYFIAFNFNYVKYNLKGR